MQSEQRIVNGKVVEYQYEILIRSEEHGRFYMTKTNSVFSILPSGKRRYWRYQDLPPEIESYVFAHLF
jgi:hypothetical protein